MMGRHDHSRDTESALHCAGRNEGALQRAGFAILFQTFDRDDVLSVGLGGEDQTRTDRFAVHQNRAGAALPFSAALLGAGEPKLVAQEIQKRAVRHRRHLDVTLIDSARHFQRRHERDSSWFCSNRNRSIAVESTRRVITSSIATRYSRLPRTSLIGLVFAKSE